MKQFLRENVQLIHVLFFLFYYLKILHALIPKSKTALQLNERNSVQFLKRSTLLYVLCLKQLHHDGNSFIFLAIIHASQLNLNPFETISNGNINLLSDSLNDNHGTAAVQQPVVPCGGMSKR